MSQTTPGEAGPKISKGEREKLRGLLKARPSGSMISPALA
jgi:hypothetical protein